MKRYRTGLEYSDLLDLLSLKTLTHFRIRHVEQRIAAGRESIPFPRDASFGICCHIWFRAIEDLNRYLRDIQVSDWKIQTGCSNEERVVRCRYCRSEYQIDFKQFGRRGNAMYVTKWLDLDRDRLSVIYRSMERIEFDPGSIRAAFEGKGQSDFDSDAVTNSKDKNGSSWGVCSLGSNIYCVILKLLRSFQIRAHEYLPHYDLLVSQLLFTR